MAYIAIMKCLICENVVCQECMNFIKYVKARTEIRKNKRRCIHQQTQLSVYLKT